MLYCMDLNNTKDRLFCHFQDSSKRLKPYHLTKCHSLRCNNQLRNTSSISSMVSNKFNKTIWWCIRTPSFQDKCLHHSRCRHHNSSTIPSHLKPIIFLPWQWINIHISRLSNHLSLCPKPPWHRTLSTKATSTCTSNQSRSRWSKSLSLRWLLSSPCKWNYQ